MIAIGVTMVIITTGIDLSSAQCWLWRLCSLPAWPSSQAGTMRNTPVGAVPLIVPILAALAIGVLCGAINGGLIARFKIPPFIATLGMMTVARGFALHLLQ